MTSWGHSGVEAKVPAGGRHDGQHEPTKTCLFTTAIRFTPLIFLNIVMAASFPGRGDHSAIHIPDLK